MFFERGRALQNTIIMSTKESEELFHIPLHSVAEDVC